MTLADKILELRTGRGLSQGDLAEELEVSRQSVSKWETGQAVPELDKIIKLADLFGVSVDQLVREGEAPEPETPKAEVTERIIYMEKPQKGLTPVQILGVVCAVVGGAMILFGFLGAAVLLLPGVGLILLSLPLLLAKKHPWLVAGWVLCLESRAVFNPYTGVAPLGSWRGFQWIYYYITKPGPEMITVLLGGVICVAQDALTLALAVLTARLCWKRWNDRRPEGQDQETA